MSPTPWLDRCHSACSSMSLNPITVREWDSGRCQLEYYYTINSPSLPHDPSKCLQTKEKGLKVTLNLRSSLEGDICKLHRPQVKTAARWLC